MVQLILERLHCDTMASLIPQRVESGCVRVGGEVGGITMQWPTTHDANPSPIDHTRFDVPDMTYSHQ